MKVQNSKKKLILFEFFGGIGCQVEAFKRGNYDVISYLIERDIDSVIGYAALHCSLNAKINNFDDLSQEQYINFLKKYNYTKKEKVVNLQRLNKFKIKQLYYATKLSNNLGDFNKLKKEEIDHILEKYKDNIKIATWSTPCQDFSVAGMMKGFSGERGMLTPKTVDIFLNIKHSFDFMLFENVPAITNRKHIDQFEALIEKLNEKFKNKYFQLNAINYDVPQNRKRIFMVTSKNKKIEYEIPKEIESTRKLSDLLEKDVDPKYFINKQQLERYRFTGNIYPSGFRTTGTVNDKEIANTLLKKGEQHILIKENTKKGYNSANSGDGIRLNFAGKSRGAVQKERAPTLLTGAGCSVGTPAKEKGKYKLNRNFTNGPLKIRRLTPLESLRLTGFNDSAYTILKEAGLSDSCIYSFCGNGIVVDVFLAIILNLELDQYLM